MATWTWASASVRGTSHSELGENRQDAFRVLAARNGMLVAVVCDGAGSATYGRYGAVLAARALSNCAQDWIGDQQTIPGPAEIETWVEDASQIIAGAAERIDAAERDFATTLVMAVSDGEKTITAHVGDGAIVARCRHSQQLLDLSWPDNGDYAATTFFLTDPSPRLRIGLANGFAIDRLALMTDGLERLALNFLDRTAHAPFFDAMFRVLPGAGCGCDAPLSRQLAAFLASDHVNGRTDDDKTLILAACA
ncbi:putative protein serine/threonine phosphatase [Sphingomonas paucimobilis]|nr:putative protein serine/threonine phosphatase [Sphingomonas paucimobilis]